MDPIKSYIEASRERFLAELFAYLRYPSYFGHGEGLDGAARWTADRLAALGAAPQYLAAGGAPAVYAEVGRGERSLLSYTHYDVQPADPLDLWDSPPFEPAVRDGKLYARGAGDDKGDTLARIHAVEAYVATYGELPLRLKFFVEGDEETGSQNIGPLAQQHAGLLRADGALWEGGELDRSERYTLYCGLKGIAYCEMQARGVDHDLHSAYAPMAPNAAWRLVQALATLKDGHDDITLDGFMENVRPPSEADLAYIRRIPFSGAETKAGWGVASFINDMPDEEALIRYITQPTCTICGIRGGSIDDSLKTVLPSTASAKLDFRLVPDLTPELVVRLLREHLDRRGFQDVQVRLMTGMVGARADTASPVVQAAVGAAREVYGHEPVVYPSLGGSGPMHALVQAVGTPGGVMAGVTYAGTRMHSPNENIRLDDYFRHIEFLVAFIRRFAAMPQ